LKNINELKKENFEKILKSELPFYMKVKMVDSLNEFSYEENLIEEMVYIIITIRFLIIRHDI
jgi:hypothetical protein